jgi:hypothetical protein
MIRKNERFRISNVKVKPSFAGWNKNTYQKLSATYTMLVCKLHILASFRKDLGARKKKVHFTCHEADFVNFPGFGGTLLCVLLVQVSSDLHYRDSHIPVKSKSHIL